MRRKTVTFWQVSTRDSVAFVAFLLLSFVWLMFLVVTVYVVLGGRKPQESPAEIAFIMASFSVAFLSIILMRRAKVQRLMRDGTMVAAQLVHFSHFQFFVTVAVQFTWRGAGKRRVVQVPSGHVTRTIGKREHVVLMVDPGDPHRFVIKELYER